MPAAKRRAVPTVERITPKIINWFQREARDMPWRQTLDPYGIWVSEIMLQQTQVKTVIPYWNRWMKRLPTIEKLAKSRESTILKLWEGLGYYTRVRNIQKAARQILQRHDGRFPNDSRAIQELSGIGRYTTGAIASIAFDLPEPILDGNVIRGLTRVFGIAGDPKSKVVNERLWNLSSKLVSKTKPGAKITNKAPLIFSGERSLLNQGLMELGATVCTPIGPSCGSCPLNRECIARNEGRIDQFPETAKRQQAAQRSFVTIALRRNEEVFIRKRPKGLVNGVNSGNGFRSACRKTSPFTVLRFGSSRNSANKKALPNPGGLRNAIRANYLFFASLAFLNAEMMSSLTLLGQGA